MLKECGLWTTILDCTYVLPQILNWKNKHLIETRLSETRIHVSNCYTDHIKCLTKNHDFVHVATTL